MRTNQEDKLNQPFDDILHQLRKGNTIESLKAGKLNSDYHQVKEWESKYGY